MKENKWMKENLLAETKVDFTDEIMEKVEKYQWQQKPLLPSLVLKIILAFVVSIMVYAGIKIGWSEQMISAGSKIEFIYSEQFVTIVSFFFVLTVLVFIKALIANKKLPTN